MQLVMSSGICGFRIAVRSESPVGCECCQGRRDEGGRRQGNTDYAALPLCQGNHTLEVSQREGFWERTHPCLCMRLRKARSLALRPVQCGDAVPQGTKGG